MSSTRKNVVPILGLVACVAAWVVGSEVRTRQDLGASVFEASRMGVRAIIASNEDLKPIGEAELFSQLSMLLEREYVDPVEDEGKLARGAVRGMVNGLLDPDSRYLDQAEWEAWDSALRGTVEGIGADLALRYDEAALEKAKESPRDVDGLTLLPDLVVRSVYPGSPAAAIGLQPGDRIYRLQGKWILSSTDILQARSLRERAAQGKISPKELARARMEFQAKTRNAKTASGARKLLSTGSGKSFEIEFERAGKKLKASVVTAKTMRPAIQERDGAVALQFVRGAGAALARLPEGPLVLDLRQSGIGDPAELARCIEAVAPEGSYGLLARTEGAGAVPLTTTKGRAAGPIRLIVDETTYGVAEAFALSLYAAGLALVEGKTAGRPYLVETFALPNGEGYALKTFGWKAGGQS